MNYGYFLFLFTCDQDRDAIINGGPWIVDDATLALEHWTPTFIPSPTHLSRTVLHVTHRSRGYGDVTATYIRRWKIPSYIYAEYQYR